MKNVSKIIGFHAKNYFIIMKNMCKMLLCVSPSCILVSFFSDIDMRKEKDNIWIIYIRLEARS